MRRASLVFALAALAVGACASSPKGEPQVPSSDPGDATNKAGTTTITSGTLPVDSPTDSLSPTPEVGEQVAPLSAPPPVSRGTPTLTDGEIAAIVATICSSEEQHAREAQKRATSERVQEVARVVAKAPDLGKLERVEQLTSITERDTPTSTHLKESAAQVADGLRSAGGAGFDKLYLDALISEDKQFIEMLDDQLIPQAQNLSLQHVLADIRTSTSSHLGMAEDIRARARR